MKTTTLAGLLILLSFQFKTLAQDTLHLVYHHTQIKPHDSTEKRIDKWIKDLKGKKVNLEVVAYYHKADFKKFSQERADELFIILNRKARSLFTINFIGPKKGKDSQRTTVDFIYTFADGSNNTVAAKKEEKTKEEPAKKKEDVATTEKAKPEKPVKTAEKTAEKKAEKPVKALDTDNYFYDTTFVNGKPVVSKRKKPKNSQSPATTEPVARENEDSPTPAKQDEPAKKTSKTDQLDTDKFFYDSTYVNGQLKVTKRKKK